MNEQLSYRYMQVRQQTEALCLPLLLEDYVIQGMDDVSPPKWHLAHSSWFFETFILNKYSPGYVTFDESFHYLFNSYYHTIGTPYPRPQRGLLSRPTVEQIYAYRHYVDKHMLLLCAPREIEDEASLNKLITLGLEHEQQHQELLLMDIKYNFSLHPNKPLYSETQPISQRVGHCRSIQPIMMNGGLVDIGYSGNEFCFDHELPQHKKFLRPYALANRLVTNAEYCEFIDAGGYSDPCWWLSEGWDLLMRQHWQAPGYWYRQHNQWLIFTLNGLLPLQEAEPVAHVSYFEADAYARWRNARLPLEEEWEHCCRSSGLNRESGVFLESGCFHPKAADALSSQPQQFFGDLWEWTASAYSPYPGFKPLNGALGEYNGKFMANQMVLRGGCCITPQEHIRTSYRNFFQPEKRWQFSGIRLAYDG